MNKVLKEWLVFTVGMVIILTGSVTLIALLILFTWPTLIVILSALWLAVALPDFRRL